MSDSKTIFLIAGEPSGDERGAELVKALKKQNPNLRFEGLGGKLMQAEGVKLVDNLCALAAIGFGDVLAKYFKIRKIFYATLHYVLRLKPDCLILIDYPGFNLRFAKQVNRRIKTFYYVSPQLWAWAKHRIHLIKETVDRMLVLFHFEEKMYQEAGIPVTWVGHPLAERAPITKSKSEMRKEYGVEHSEKVVALLPGSRKTEIERILPVILESAALISKKIPSTAFLLPESENVERNIYESILQKYQGKLTIKRMRGEAVEKMLRASDAAIVTSGTATLETALTLTPFVILYKTHWTTYTLGRILIQIPYIGLVNVVAGRKIVQEFIQHDAKAGVISREVIRLIEDQSARQQAIQNLEEVQKNIGPSGAASRTASAILANL